MKLTKREQLTVRIIETLLKAARGNNCSVCRILTTVCANHLFSTEVDECHINGIEFGQQIDELGLESLNKVTQPTKGA